MLLENENDVLKWFKPAKGQLNMYYSSDNSYEPDFIVETETAKLMCEPKRASELQDDVVHAKARAAVTWCANATSTPSRTAANLGPYLLIPMTPSPPVPPYQP